MLFTREVQEEPCRVGEGGGAGLYRRRKDIVISGKINN